MVTFVQHVTSLAKLLTFSVSYDSDTKANKQNLTTYSISHISLSTLSHDNE